MAAKTAPILIKAGAIAAGNNLSFGGDTATILTDTQQTAAGDATARVDLGAESHMAR